MARLRLRPRPPARPDEPLVTIAPVEGVLRIAALDGPAEALGIHAGQKLTDARVLCPGLVAIPATPEEDVLALRRIADWCGRFSPLVATEAPDGLRLDISGCAHLWGDEAGLAEDLLWGLERHGMPVRVAIAGSHGAAWALARAGKRMTLVPPGREAHALGPLPPALLRLPEEIATGLAGLGLSTVAQVTAAPRPALARRFGASLHLRLDQALGRAEEPAAFHRAPPDWFERLAFAEPIATPEDLARALEELARRLCARMADADRGGRGFEASFYRVDGAAARISVATALPSRDPSRLARLLAAKLETVDPGFGVEVMTLAAARAEALGAAQARMADITGASRDNTAIAPTVDAIANRLGAGRLWRVAPRDNHVPERAVTRLAPLDAPCRRGWPATAPRPLRVLRRPEAIEAIAPVPDDPPVQFNWRGLVHRVRRADGPERIGREWWLKAAPQGRPESDLVRDYYRVEDQDGGRYWIFRAGLYAPGRPSRWYLHGLFG